MDGTLAVWDPQQGHVADMLIGNRLQPTWPAGEWGTPTGVRCSPTLTGLAPSRWLAPGTSCSAVRNTPTATGVALPAAQAWHRGMVRRASTTWRRSRYCRSRGPLTNLPSPAAWAAHFALRLSPSQEWSHFYCLTDGAEIDRVEVSDQVAASEQLLAVIDSPVTASTHAP